MKNIELRHVDAQELTKITIEIRGGLVVGVNKSDDGVVVEIWDYDIEGQCIDAELLDTDNEGEQFIRSEW